MFAAASHNVPVISGCLNHSLLKPTINIPAVVFLTYLVKIVFAISISN